MNKDWPDLSRTKKAIEEYDRAYDNFQWDKLNELGEKIGEAYGLDTIDRNDPKTCKNMIRPGNRDVHPEDLSFVRRMVLTWENQKKKEN